MSQEMFSPQCRDWCLDPRSDPDRLVFWLTTTLSALSALFTLFVPGGGLPCNIAVMPHPRIALDELAADAVLLCSTHRLARSLRLANDRTQIARGLTRWQPLLAQTVAQWLDAVLEEAQLSGEIPAAAAPRLPLSALQERILWDRAIEAGSAGLPVEALFDREGLAVAATEANALLETWQMRIPGSEQSEETRQFLRWREEFRRRCSDAGWLEPARTLDWQLGCIASGAGRLPRQLAFAGFDRLNPQETRLAGLLDARGVIVAELELGLSQPAEVIAHALPDREAECRAAAAWASEKLEANPQARLGIVVPELSALRDTLSAILDDALDPEAASPALAEMPRRYNFSLGGPLARQPIVGAALKLLVLAAHPRRVKQEEFGELLRLPYWSAGISEADGRAQLDARMRETLAPTISFERALRFAHKVAASGANTGVAAPRLLTDLAAFKAVQDTQPSRQSPSAWAKAFGCMLGAAAWPGERTLSSHEYQAKRAFAEVLDSLAELDAMLGRVSISEANRRLVQLCRERIFQPETEGEPPLEVMGLLEAVGMPLDALWVMGMNDHLWPPPARPNPLLPAELQRRARAPNASAEVQGEFALAINRRLLRSAREVRFSWSLREAHRELRASPLLAGIPAQLPSDAPERFAGTSLIEALAVTIALERIADDCAPAVAEGEVVRGGTGLLRAQAICPAWAFYRYRLGAKALGVPVEGLDAADRGTLVHAVLQHFWTGRGSQELLSMSGSQRQEAIAAAVDSGLQEFNAKREEALTPRFLELERERLLHLVSAWLAIEGERKLPFRVISCEAEAEVEIEGIGVRLVVDRIDELEDGRRVILDYKTGANVSQASWGEERISEPQLPIYAAMLAQAAKSAPAAVAFAKVRLEESGFVGIAAEAGLLPKVAGIADSPARRLFPNQSTWIELMIHWQERIAAIAREIRAGEAAVGFASEKDLEYCEVMPLLRLAERRAQSESE